MSSHFQTGLFQRRLATSEVQKEPQAGSLPIIVVAYLGFLISSLQIKLEPQ